MCPSLFLASKPLINPHNPIDTLRRCRGLYECPKKESGGRLGPLVAYAGEYDLPDGSKKHWVGEIYYNVAKIEEVMYVLDHFADLICFRLNQMGYKQPVFDCVLGAPMGGILLTGALGRILEEMRSNFRVAYAEKKVVEPEKDDHREKSIMVIDRHPIRPSKRIAIVEDVCNNISTPGKLLPLITAAEAELVAIFCAFNRSGVTDWNGIPIISACEVPTPQYQQDDPYVAVDIAAGNILWKPKDHWGELEKFIPSYSPA